MNREAMLLELAALRRRVGNTPAMELLYPECSPILAKLEFHNLTGTIKDRPALNLIENLVRTLPEDQLQGADVLDYSGGSMAASMTVICKHLGWTFHLATVRSCPTSFLKRLEAQGTHVHVSQGDGFYSVIELAHHLKRENPKLIFLDQNNNVENFNAHYFDTAREIVSELRGRRPAAWVASVGTGGTFAGVFERLSSIYPDLQGHVCTPAEQPFGDDRPPNNLPKYQGSGGFGLGRKQPFVTACEARVTKFWTCSYDDALNEARSFYEQHGIAIGTSAAANLRTAKAVARETPSDQVVTTVFASLANDNERQLILGT